MITPERAEEIKALVFHAFVGMTKNLDNCMAGAGVIYTIGNEEERVLALVILAAISIGGFG